MPSPVRGPPRLITIPLSHYCEKARWALDVAGLPYVEEPHLPLLHRRHSGGGSVPVLVTRERTYPDSNAILRYADERAPAARLYPANAGARQEAIELEQWLDRELGPPARRWAYGRLLGSPLLRPCFATGVPALERALAPLLLRVLPPLIRRGYRVSPEGTARALERIHEVFARVDEKLADGRPSLVAEGFGAADLTFASLAAPLLLPPQYGGVLPRIEDVPAELRAEVERFRATRAGRHALATYAGYRRAR